MTTSLFNAVAALSEMPVRWAHNLIVVVVEGLLEAGLNNLARGQA